MLELLKAFFEDEYNFLVDYLERNDDLSNIQRIDAIDRTMARCCGVSFFAQKLDIPYEEIDKLWNDTYWHKFWALK